MGKTKTTGSQSGQKINRVQRAKASNQASETEQTQRTGAMTIIPYRIAVLIPHWDAWDGLTAYEFDTLAIAFTLRWAYYLLRREYGEFGAVILDTENNIIGHEI